MALTELIDTDTAYADPADVEDYFRAKTFDASSTPTLSRVEQKLLNASDEVDKITRRAWRVRRVNAKELPVQFSHKQEKRAERIRSGTRRLNNTDQWGTVALPHESVKPLDAAEGDKLEVLLPREVKDITDNSGRAEGDYVLDQNAGQLYVRMSLFRRGPYKLGGSGITDRPKVRITYRYGRTTGQVPGDIRKATAKLVAADLIDSDGYSDLVPGGDSAPDQQDSARKYDEEARQTLREDYRYAKVL